MWLWGQSCTYKVASLFRGEKVKDEAAMMRQSGKLKEGATGGPCTEETERRDARYRE